MFYSLYVKTDVTALDIWENFLFASIGGFLGVYDLNANQISKTNIFEGQKIYGIKPNSDGSKLLIYGGKSIALIHNQGEFKKLVILESKILSDWILDAKWIENDKKIVTTFMHNKTTLWTLNITSEISVKCEERCILYSAHICFDTYKEIMILAGTVFSEVLIWKPYCKTEKGWSPVLKRLRQHRGVIFSINCNIDNGLICSTSDDRSAVLWRIKNKHILENLNPTNSDQLEIIPSCQVYGHLSRVFRCLILSDYFATAGEDSLLFLWNFKGEMLRKIDTHQGGPIWSLAYDTKYNRICTGGNDGGILLFKINPYIVTNSLLLPILYIPKIIGILHSGNLVCLSETATLYYFQQESKNWNKIIEHLDLKSYSIMQISPCKKMMALAGFKGQIYVYYEEKNYLQQKFTCILKNKTRIFSFHWLTCKIFLVCQSHGKLNLCFLHDHKIYPIQTFILPENKERWSTCACIIDTHVIVGDRKGNIYNFRLGRQNIINTVKKAHNYLGITRLYTKNDIIISLGRDGILKKYQLFNGHLKCIDSNKTKFSWLAALDETILLSFFGEKVVISDCLLQRILFETQCGGGHRSWDYSISLETFKFCFIKKKVINTIQLSLDDITPIDVIQGFHVHEINCVKTINLGRTSLLFSGGEDTILRVSVLKNNIHHNLLDSLKVHLSSIRSIIIYNLPKQTGEYLIFTAGGRAQIILWHVCIKNDVDATSLICTEKYNYYEPLPQNKAETRVMDMAVINFNENEQLILYSGYSDGSIKIFSVLYDMQLKYLNSIFFTTHSVTKIMSLLIRNTHFLLSMNTNGDLVFWEVSSIMNFDSKNYDPIPFAFKIHQSGINSCSYKIIDNSLDSTLLFLSGGDDNSVILSLFELSVTANTFTISKLSSFENKAIHCAQITGTYLVDKYFVTSSVDQRIAVWEWYMIDKNIKYNFIQMYNTAIADPQGIDCFMEKNVIKICIYGNGIEYLKVEVGS